MTAHTARRDPVGSRSPTICFTLVGVGAQGSLAAERLASARQTQTQREKKRTNVSNASRPTRQACLASRVCLGARCCITTSCALAVERKRPSDRRAHTMIQLWLCVDPQINYTLHLNYRKPRVWCAKVTAAAAAARRTTSSLRAPPRRAPVSYGLLLALVWPFGPSKSPISSGSGSDITLLCVSGLKWPRLANSPAPLELPREGRRVASQTVGLADWPTGERHAG